jgi:hypothetical protein
VARPLLGAWLIVCSLAVSVAPAYAVVPSEELFPNTTAAYVSVPDVDALRDKWNKTELGKFFDDPVMKPFMDDLNEQLKAKLSKTGVKLGITWDDVETVYAGELALGAVQPENDPKQHALALVVDVTGKEAQVDALLKKIVKSQREKGGKITPRKVDGVDVTEILLAKDVRGVADRAFYAVSKNQLVAADHLGVITGILARIKKDAPGALSDVVAYQVAMKNLTTAAGPVKPELRWFVDPFRYAEVSRAMSAHKRKRGTDALKVLRNQGFDAIKGAGGFVSLMSGENDIEHRTFVFAPTDKKASEGDKYRLGARMLDFINKPTEAPPKWIPSDVATFLSINWNMKDAFGKYLGSIVDEFAGDEIFDEVLESIKTDPNGPEVDLRKDLIAHLGERAMLVTDAVEPIDVKSERLMFIIELDKPKIVAATLDKAMSKDPDARKREYKGHVIWEIVNDDVEAVHEVEEIVIDGGGGFVPVSEPMAAPAEEEEEGEAKLPNSAIAVAHGHLIIASHVDFIIRALDPPAMPLDAAHDFQRVEEALDKLGGGKQAMRQFVRTDKAYNTTYELLRQNKMPQGETVLARALNRLLADDDADEAELRKQSIDGSKMPSYDKVKKYFGPAGFYLTTEDDGWMISGCLLKKDAGKPEAPKEDDTKKETAAPKEAE